MQINYRLLEKHLKLKGNVFKFKVKNVGTNKFFHFNHYKMYGYIKYTRILFIRYQYWFCCLLRISYLQLDIWYFSNLNRHTEIWDLAKYLQIIFIHKPKFSTVLIKRIEIKSIFFYKTIQFFTIINSSVNVFHIYYNKRCCLILCQVETLSFSSCDFIYLHICMQICRYIDLRVRNTSGNRKRSTEYARDN